jgi:hypothetical protein
MPPGESGAEVTQDISRRPPLGVRVELPFGFTRREALGSTLTADEAERVIELLRIAYNGGPAWFAYGGNPVDHLLWKARDCPIHTHVTYHEIGDQLVRFGWGIHRRYFVRGVELTVSDGGEAATSPDLQGRGLYSKMRRLTREWGPRTGLDMSLGVSTHPAILHNEQGDPQRPQLGNNVRLFFRPLDLRRLHDLGGYSGNPDGPSNTSLAIEARRRHFPRPMWARRIVWRGRQLAARLRHRPYRRQRAGWTIRETSSFDARVDGFFELAARPFDLIQVRNAEYLNWRFCDPRSGPFVVRVAEQDGQLLGYCVLLTLESRPAIVDLLALPGRLDVVRSLVEDALAEFRRRGAPAVAFRTVERHPYNEVLRRLGFLPRRAVAVASFRPIAIDEQTTALLRDPACRVHLTYGDTDHV